MENSKNSKEIICVNLFDQILFESEPLLVDETKYAKLIDEASKYLTSEDEEKLKELLINIKKQVMKAVKKMPVKKVVTTTVEKKSPVKKVSKVVKVEEPITVEVELEETNNSIEPIVKKVTKVVKVTKRDNITVTEGSTDEPKTIEFNKDTEEVEEAVTGPESKKVKVKAPVKNSLTINIPTEYEGIKIGDELNHAKNGVGEVVGFYVDKKKEGVFHPKVKFGKNTSIISINVAKKLV